MQDDTAAGVLSLAKRWSFPLQPGVSEKICLYLAQLLRWNERVNLTGARDFRELLGDHLPDSFALAKVCPQGANLVDVGSGGGLPAVPFAIFRPDCQTTLVEPRAKRVAFLRTAVRECELSEVSVLRARVEDLQESSYSVASSKATFSPEKWLQTAPRLLVPGGLAIVFAADREAVRPSSATLVNSIAYATLGESERWCGCFRFT